MAVERKNPSLKLLGAMHAVKYYTREGMYYEGTENFPCMYLPRIRYNQTLYQWEVTNDGENYFPIIGTVSGSINNSQKYSTIISTILNANTNFVLAAPYVPSGNGDNLDIFLNGQLLTPKIGNIQGDYIEINNTTIQFYFNVPKGALLTYVIR
jgi:hypothetical protein